MDARYMWAQFDANLDELELNRENTLQALEALDSQLKHMRGELDNLSTEAQTAKKAHLATDSVNSAMLERLHYLQSIKQLPIDIDTVRTQLDKLKPAHAITALRDGLLLLKNQLTHIYATARAHSTLANPIGRPTHRTWENTLLSHSRSPMKREGLQRPDSIGMRLLLPPDTIHSMNSLLDLISKHCSLIGSSWLDNPENLEAISHIASRVAVKFRDTQHQPLALNALAPELSSVALQLPQQIFWLCRTVQELKILLVGPPTQASSLQGSPRNLYGYASPHSDNRAIASHILAFGPGSYIFDKYWTQIEQLARGRLSALPVPSVRSLSDIDSYLHEVHDINSRIWILTKMLWVDTPQLVRHTLSHGPSTLHAYLELPSIDDGDVGLKNELPIQVPQLCVFSLPHVQVEQVALKWASFVDQALQPLYEAWSQRNPTLEDSMMVLSQINLFWANAKTGPWYPMAKSGLSPSMLVLRFLPAVQSLRSAATTCAKAIERSKPEDKAAFADLAVWTKSCPATAWLDFLTSCLCMLVCCPGLLAVEDFLLDSLSTPLTNTKPDIARETYAQLQLFLSAPRSLDPSDLPPQQNPIENAQENSFWTQDAVSHVLDTLKLGSIKTVLLLRISDLLKA